MHHRWTRAIQLIILCGAATCAVIGADTQVAHRFGESVAWEPDASFVVTRRDVGEVRARSQSPSMVPSSDENIVAFECRYGGSGAYTFRTDRTDPSRSDIVALCGTVRVNILKLGSGTFDNPNVYRFGTVGALQGKDGRWVSIVAGGAPPSILLFSLPPGCIGDRVQLSVALSYDLGGTTTKRELLFARPSEPDQKRP